MFQIHNQTPTVLAVLKPARTHKLASGIKHASASDRKQTELKGLKRKRLSLHMCPVRRYSQIDVGDTAHAHACMRVCVCRRTALWSVRSDLRCGSGICWMSMALGGLGNPSMRPRTPPARASPNAFPSFPPWGLNVPGPQEQVERWRECGQPCPLICAADRSRGPGQTLASGGCALGKCYRRETLDQTDTGILR